MSKYIDLDQVEFLKVDGNKEFNHGVDCCINTLLKQERVTAIPLDKVKRACEEIQELIDKCGKDTMEDIKMGIGMDLALTILNSLLESEEYND